MKDYNGNIIEVGDYVSTMHGSIVYEVICINNNSISLKGITSGKEFTTRIHLTKFRILEPEELI